MEDNMLVLVDNSVLTETERTEINLHIDGIIEKYRQDSAELSRMALESASLITSVEARSGGMMRQGFFSRLWNGFTGKNHKLTASNQRDIAKAQYLSQQMLNKLFEQNLVQFEMMVAIEHKLNSLARDIFATNQKLLKVCNVMTEFLTEFREMKAGMAEFRRNDDLLFWKETIRHDRIFQGKSCDQLNVEQKIVCIANDFYTISKGKWNDRDLLFLKSVMQEVGLDPDKTAVPADVLKLLIGDEAFLQRFFRKTGYDISTLSSENADTPFLTCLAKLEKLKSDENYIVETVYKFTPSVFMPEVRFQMAIEYTRGLTGRNIEKNMSCFDMVMELVNDLFMAMFFIVSEEMIVDEEIEATEPENVQLLEDNIIPPQETPWWFKLQYIHIRSAQNLCISPDGEILFSGADNITMWDTASGKSISMIKRNLIPDSYINNLDITPDGKILFVSSCYKKGYDKTKSLRIEAWDISTHKLLATIENKGPWPISAWLTENSPNVLCVTPDGKILFSDSGQRINIWNIEIRNNIGFIENEINNKPGLLQCNINSLCVTPDSKNLFIGARESIKIWDIETRKQTGILQTPSDSNDALCITPDGKTLFNGTQKGINIWDINTCKQIGTFKDSTMAKALHITPDGKTLFSKGDKTINVWDIENRKVLNTIPSTGQFCITPDGRTLISADDDGIRFW